MHYLVVLPLLKPVTVGGDVPEIVHNSDTMIENQQNKLWWKLFKSCQR